MNYRGRRATIMGLGHFGGGVAAARWLARQGAIVTVTDTADEAALADALAALANAPIAAVHLGGHRPEDFSSAELLVVNPAVRPGNPLVEIARRAGAAIDTEIGLFLKACPAHAIGVTGSNGKSTTAAMTAAILAAGGVRAWLGGNLGGSLLDNLGEIRGDDWVVLELSSFQLWHLGGLSSHPSHLSDSLRLPPMPQIAVVTGCSPNHLDWHSNWAEYVAAKQSILLRQTAADMAVLNSYDAEANSWRRLVRGQLLELPPLEELPKLQLPGRHNLINAACAAAAGGGAGCDGPAIRRGLENFQGLPQRLEWFAVIDGRRFYNDSSATTPESTVAALESLAGDIWLLAGGADKGCDFDPMAADVARRTKAPPCSAPRRKCCAARIAAETADFPCVVVKTLDEALHWCWSRSQPGRYYSSLARLFQPRPVLQLPPAGRRVRPFGLGPDRHVRADAEGRIIH